MTRQLWIFQVSGGEPFESQVQGNPLMRHDGNMSILRCLCTDEQAAEIEDEIRAHGAVVKSNCPMQTPEQTAERKNILQVLGGERAFPCVRCPECAWFDPHIESLCGAGLAFGGQGWDHDAVEGSMSSENFREDFVACPLREGATQ